MLFSDFARWQRHKSSCRGFTWNLYQKLERFWCFCCPEAFLWKCFLYYHWSENHKMDERTHQRQRAYSHFSCLCSSFQKKTVPRPLTNTLPNRNVVYFVSYAFLPLHSLVPPPMDAHVLCLAGTAFLWKSPARLLFLWTLDFSFHFQMISLAFILLMASTTQEF